MRHRKKGNHLGRTASHKKALMRNLAIQVFEHKEIRTTLAKAKELRSYVERLITYGKKGTLHHRRLAFSFLQNKQAVTTLFDEIAPTYETRNGGYTRIIKLGNRKGDNAKISIFQLVGFEKVQSKEEKKKKKKAEEATTETKKVEEESKPVEETAKNEEPKETEATAEVKEETVAEETKNEEAAEKDEKTADEPKEEKKEENTSSEEK
jgi:large subunit ribosomal protein L17